MAVPDPTDQEHHRAHNATEVRGGLWRHAHVHEHPEASSVHHQLLTDGQAHQHWHPDPNNDSTLPHHHPDHDQSADHNEDESGIHYGPI